MVEHMVLYGARIRYRIVIIGISVGWTLTHIIAEQDYLLELTKIIELWVSSLPVQESTSVMALAESYINGTVRLPIIGSLRNITSFSTGLL